MRELKRRSSRRTAPLAGAGQPILCDFRLQQSSMRQELRVPTELNIEIRCRRNQDGTFNGVAYQDEAQLADFEVQNATCEQIRHLYLRVSAEYPPDVAIRISKSCRDCVSPGAIEEAVVATKRARSTIHSTWRNVADLYTLGWGSPVEAVAAGYPFISEGVSSIRRNISRELPILIYLDRVSPPTQAVVAIPYRDQGGNPYNCRLLGSHSLEPEEVVLLTGFSQALWFLIGNGILPHPQASDAMRRMLTQWTGRALLEL